jgi:hypothetical protein
MRQSEKNDHEIGTDLFFVPAEAGPLPIMSKADIKEK